MTIALNVLYNDNETFYTDIEKIYPSYVSKHNSERKKQLFF